MYFSAEKQQTYICLWYLPALHNRSHLWHTGPVNKGKHEKTNVWEDEFWIGSCTSKVPLRRKDSLKNFFFFSFLLFQLWASLLRWKGSQLASSFSFHFLCYDFLFRDLLKIVCACMLSHHQFVFHFPLWYYWMLCYVLKFPWILSFDLFLIIIYAVFPTILALGFLLFSVHVLPFGYAFTRKTLYFCHHVNDS